jgi:predicted  nucleic acid-binding Zn-ribbon protein
MTPELKILVELQDNLASQRKITSELENPKAFQAIRKDYEAVLKERQECEAALEEASKGHKDLELDIDAKKEEIKKLRQQMQMVRNQKEYSAALNSIDTIQKILSQQEDKLLAKLEAVETEKKRMEAAQPNWLKIEGRYGEINTRWQTEKRDLEERLDRLQHEQKFLEKDLPEHLLTLFRRMLKLRQGLAVAPVEAKSCSGCHILLRPQQFADIVKGEELVRCDQCQRFLYAK